MPCASVPAVRCTVCRQGHQLTTGSQPDRPESPWSCILGLNLSNNLIEVVENVSGMKSLVELNLRKNKISQIAADLYGLNSMGQLTARQLSVVLPAAYLGPQGAGRSAPLARCCQPLRLHQLELRSRCQVARAVCAATGAI